MMTFHEQLIERTHAQREYLLGAPAIGRALAGDITRELYIAFLTQAYHHVRHRMPLLMAVGSRLPDRLAWLQPSLVHYVEEDQVHDQWILSDIEAAGGDRQAAVRTKPDVATDAMVAYAYDMVSRRNPVGFFGMVHVDMLYPGWIDFNKIAIPQADEQQRLLAQYDPADESGQETFASLLVLSARSQSRRGHDRRRSSRY